MGVQGFGEDKKNISPEIQAFPTTSTLFTGDGDSPAEEAVVARAILICVRPSQESRGRSF